MPDRMTPEQRSYCMSRIKGKNTSLEKLVRSELHCLGYRFRKHSKDLPGKPDIVFRKQKLAVFVDGNFWHGYRFNQWKHRLKKYWQEKISGNIKRDKRNFQRLRRAGWTVIRIWEHQAKRDLELCISRIVFYLCMVK